MILGINSFFEHPSITLIDDGKVLFAAEEERFSGIKHGRKYNPYVPFVPIRSLYAGLKQVGATSEDILEVAYSYSSKLHARSLYGCLTGARFSPLREEVAALRTIGAFRKSFSEGHETTLMMRDRISPDSLTKARYTEWPHHLSHAASSFYMSKFPNSLVVVCDGAGENACTSIYTADEQGLKKIFEIVLPHSLGHFYSAITRHLGFEPFSDEFKVMGLSAYGKDAYGHEMSKLVTTTANGNYFIDQKLLRNLSGYLAGQRQVGDPLTEVHYNIAKSAQLQLERAVLGFLEYWRMQTNQTNLCLAGGTFLNCVLNGKIAKSGMFSDIFVQPAASDAGTSLGAGILSSISKKHKIEPCSDYFLGTQHNREDIKAALDEAGVEAPEMKDDEIIPKLASLLFENKIVAVFRGGMEFGPRALGNRSLLASPISPDMKNRLNSIKGREDFRPVAPLIPEERFHEFFNGEANPYMLFTSEAKRDQQDKFPSGVHVDGSSRVQSVSVSTNKFLHTLLNAFSSASGVPILINTSFNIRGKPIIEDPREALACFFTSKIDALLLENFLLQKK